MRKKVIKIISRLFALIVTPIIAFNFFHFVFDKKYSEAELAAHDNALNCGISIEIVAKKCYAFREKYGRWPDTLKDLGGDGLFYTFNGVLITYDSFSEDEGPSLNAANCSHGGYSKDEFSGHPEDWDGISLGHGLNINMTYSKHRVEKALLVSKWLQE